MASRIRLQDSFEFSLEELTQPNDPHNYNYNCRTRTFTHHEQPPKENKSMSHLLALKRNISLCLFVDLIVDLILNLCAIIKVVM